MYIYDVEYVQGGQGGPLHVNFHSNGRVGGFGAEPCSSKPPQSIFYLETWLFLKGWIAQLLWGYKKEPKDTSQICMG